jgi:hypothetical protein
VDSSILRGNWLESTEISKESLLKNFTVSQNFIYIYINVLIKVKMDLGEIGRDGRDWIELAQDRDQWRALVNTVMNLRVP